MNLLNPKTVPLLGYPKIIPNTKFEHFGVIRFWVMLQKNRQTDGLENPTHADRHDIVGMGNEKEGEFREKPKFTSSMVLDNYDLL